MIVEKAYINVNRVLNDKIDNLNYISPISNHSEKKYFRYLKYAQ